MRERRALVVVSSCPRIATGCTPALAPTPDQLRLQLGGNNQFVTALCSAGQSCVNSARTDSSPCGANPVGISGAARAWGPCVLCKVNRTEDTGLPVGGLSLARHLAPGSWLAPQLHVCSQHPLHPLQPFICIRKDDALPPSRNSACCGSGCVVHGCVGVWVCGCGVCLRMCV